MSAVVGRRARRVRYTRICQHCGGEIRTTHSYVNFWYSLLCRFCFRSNAFPI
jgi:ribosomal protein S14